MVIDPVTKRSIKTMALRAIALRSGDWEPFLEHLEKSYKETNNEAYLMEICKLRFDLKDWEYVANYSMDLVQRIQTSHAFRLAIYASWNAKRHDLCLELINLSKRAF